MSKNNLSIDVEQIYNFIAQYPNIENISNIERVMLFLKEYYNHSCYIYLDCKDKLVIRISRRKKSINLSKIPNFFDRNNFIKWLVSLL